MNLKNYEIVKLIFCLKFNEKPITIPIIGKKGSIHLKMRLNYVIRCMTMKPLEIEIIQKRPYNKKKVIALTVLAVSKALSR